MTDIFFEKNKKMQIGIEQFRSVSKHVEQNGTKKNKKEVRKNKNEIF